MSHRPETVLFSSSEIRKDAPRRFRNSDDDSMEKDLAKPEIMQAALRMMRSLDNFSPKALKRG